MPSPESVYEDMEGDHRSREGEIRLVQSIIQKAESQTEKDMLKRSLILLSYAHLEGFCKFTLYAYIGAINALNIPCSNASYPVAAAGLSKVFSALRDASSKHDAFRRAMPDDTKLHLSAREQIFVESYDQIMAQIVLIPDNVVDTKSNLSSDTLRKLLFQLGLNYLTVDSHNANINKLVNVRNAIAHGDRLLVPTDKALEDYCDTVFEVMKFLKGEIYAALKEKVYLRQNAGLREPA